MGNFKFFTICKKANSHCIHPAFAAACAADKVPVNNLHSKIKTLSEAPGLEEEFSLTYKALGLSVAKVILTCFSNFLAKLAD